MNATMTKEEAAQVLLGYARVILESGADAKEPLAFMIGAKALIKDGIHRRRNHASRVARGLPPFCQPSANPAPDCQGLANPPQAVCQGSAKTEESCQTLAKAEGGAA